MKIPIVSNKITMGVYNMIYLIEYKMKEDMLSIIDGIIIKLKKVIIERKKLEENIQKIKKMSEMKDEKVKIIAVVKCNGYGLGAIEYTKVLIENGIEIFAVSNVEEAIQLREAGIENDIIMLSGIAIKEEIEKLIDNDIILTIGSKEDIEIIEEIAEEKDIEIKAHLKIDTGMGRYGFIYNQPEILIENLQKINRIKIIVS